MKRNLKEKMLAWVLTLTMVVTLIPAVGGVAYADESEVVAAEEQEVTAAEETEKIQVPDPLTYKTVINGVDGAVPGAGQFLTTAQINYMLVATGDTAADANYKLKVTQLYSLNEGHWDNMNLSSLDEFTFQPNTEYRLEGYFQLDMNDYKIDSYGVSPSYNHFHYINAKVNGVSLGEGSAYYDDQTNSLGKNSVKVYYRFTTGDVPPVSMQLSSTELTYNGAVQTPIAIVKNAYGQTLVNGIDYDVTYSGGRKYIGAYPVTVAMKPDSGYTGSKTLYFNINPKGATIKKPSAAKKAFTAKWKKQSSKMPKARVTGYQIRYSTSPSMAGAKTKTVKKYNKTSVKVKKLAKKTTYYVQVRTYMKVGGRNYYSNWSGVKSVKTK